MAYSSTQSESEYMRRCPNPGLIRVVNVVMRALLRSPLHRAVSGRLVLLEVTGRKTGHVYSIPIGYVPSGDDLYLGTAGTWTRNLRDAAGVRLWLRGRPYSAHADLVEDPQGMASAYCTIIAHAPHFGRMIGVTLDSSSGVDLAHVERVRREGHVVVRIHDIVSAH